MPARKSVRRRRFCQARSRSDSSSRRTRPARCRRPPPPTALKHVASSDAPFVLAAPRIGQPGRRNARGKRESRDEPPCLGRRQRQPCLCTPTSRCPLVHPTPSQAWRRSKPLQNYAHPAMPVRRRVMHKSPRPAFSTTHIPATRPPVGPRLRDSFLFVNGFSLVCRLRTTPRATSRDRQIALGATIERNNRFRLSTVHPRPGAVIHRPCRLTASPLPPAPRRRL